MQQAANSQVLKHAGFKKRARGSVGYQEHRSQEFSNTQVNMPNSYNKVLAPSFIYW